MTPEFLTCLYILGVYAALLHGAECPESHYSSAAGECCLLCTEGSVVLNDCHSNPSTTQCKPCFKGTFTNKPNGNHTCFPCKICENGLYISQNCTTIQDTVCEVLDGYYCGSHSDDRDCSLAVKHSKCQPGEQIKTPGSKTSDTVCEPCPSGFYSPEGVNCSKWTDCSVKNEIVDKQGTSITDVQCKSRRNRYGLIAAVLIYTVFLLSLIGSCVNLRNRGNRTLNIPVEETNP